MTASIEFVLLLKIERNIGSIEFVEIILTFASIEGIPPPSREDVVKVFWASSSIAEQIVGLENLRSVTVLAVKEK